MPAWSPTCTKYWHCDKKGLEARIARVDCRRRQLSPARVSVRRSSLGGTASSVLGREYLVRNVSAPCERGGRRMLCYRIA